MNNSKIIVKEIMLPRSEGKHQREWGIWKEVLDSTGVGMITPSRSSNSKNWGSMLAPVTLRPSVELAKSGAAVAFSSDM